MIIILTVFLTLSLLFNLFLYKSNRTLQEEEHSEFEGVKQSLITTTEEYINTLEQINKTEELNLETLKLLSSPTIRSLSEQYKSSIDIYWNISSKNEMRQYTSEFKNLWVYVTNYSDINTTEDLDVYIKELRRQFKGFKKGVEEF